MQQIYPLVSLRQILCDHWYHLFAQFICSIQNYKRLFCNQLFSRLVLLPIRKGGCAVLATGSMQVNLVVHHMKHAILVIIDFE